MPLPAADALIPRAYRASAICPVTLPRGMLLIKRAYLSPFVLTAYELVEIERVRGLDGRVKTPLARKLPIASRGGLSLTIHRLFLH